MTDKEILKNAKTLKEQPVLSEEDVKELKRLEQIKEAFKGWGAYGIYGVGFPT